MPDSAKLTRQQQRNACFVLGTTIPATALTDVEVVAGYKGQSAVERGFRFLKAPVFFVSSLFELVASFANQSNLLQWWEKTDSGA